MMWEAVSVCEWQTQDKLYIVYRTQALKTKLQSFWWLEYPGLSHFIYLFALSEKTEPSQFSKKYELRNKNEGNTGDSMLQ